MTGIREGPGRLGVVYEHLRRSWASKLDNLKVEFGRLASLVITAGSVEQAGFPDIIKFDGGQTHRWGVEAVASTKAHRNRTDLAK